QRRLRDLRPDVPDSVVQVIERAIEPDPLRRYQTAGEFEHALIAASGSQAAPVLADGSLRSRWRGWSLAATVVIAVALLAALLTVLMPAGAAGSRPLVTRFTIGPPFTSGSWPRISPDGRFVVFGAIVEGRERFWVRALDRVSGWPVMNTTANESPFWSPD